MCRRVLMITIGSASSMSLESGIWYSRYCATLSDARSKMHGKTMQREHGG